MIAHPETSVMGVKLAGAQLWGADSAGGDHLPTARVTLRAAAQIEQRWRQASNPKTVLERGRTEAGPFLQVAFDRVLGYHVSAIGCGAHIVAPDGRTVQSYLPNRRAMMQRRLLASQVYPLISTLNGNEVLHAAAAVVKGKLVAIAARSGTGKSSTLLHLLARGARFHTDDALALGVADGRAHAHPGPPLLNLSAALLEDLSDNGRAVLGRQIGETEKLHFRPESSDRGLPLSGLVLLERSGASAGSMAPAQRLAPTLLGHAYLAYVTSAGRLQRQLDVATAVAQHVPAVRLVIATEQPPAEVARFIWEWVEQID